MAAATKNITIEQGATFRLPLVYQTKDDQGNVTPVDVTTYTARMQIRQSVASDTALLSLETGSGITMGANGAIDIEATPAQTAALNIRSGVYDLELQAGDGRVTRLLQGKVTVSPEVTR